MEIRTDRRTLVIDPRPLIHARLKRRSRGWLEREIRFAAEFDEIRTSRHYRLEDCASVAEYGEKLGYDPRQVRRWVNLGLVFRCEPRAKPRVRSGHLTLENAELIAPIYRNPKRLGEDDDWIELAESCTSNQLRAHVRRRVEEVASGKACRDRTIAAPDDVWDKFARARDVASTQAKRPLTEGETLGTVLDCYLDRHDELRVAIRRTEMRCSRALRPEGKRSRALPPKPSAPGRRSRHVPNSVADAVRIRAKGCCEFPGCHNRRGLQIAHVQPFGPGGPHDARNLLLLCADHHVLFDAGRLVLLGWGEDGLPRFEMRQRRPRGPP